MSHAGLLSREAQGRYRAHSFFVVLSADTPLLVPHAASVVAKDHFPVFVHEYVHFVHNLSTASFLQSLRLRQNRYVALSKALIAAGVDGGRIEVPDSLEGRAMLGEVNAALRALEGDTGPSSVSFVENLDLTVSELSRTSERRRHEQSEYDIESQLVVVSRDLGGQRPENATIRFGMLAVSEVVAFAVERLLFGIEAATLPAVPYRLGDAIYEHVVGESATPMSIARIGTAALATIEPGRVFVDLLQGVRAARERGENEQSAVDDAVLCLRDDYIRPLTQRLLKSELPGLRADLEGRGLLGQAAEWLVDRFEDGLARRAEAPTFDITRLNAGDPKEGVASLMRLFPPGYVLQECDGDDDEVLRDQLTGLAVEDGRAAADRDVRGALGGLYAVNHYTDLHHDSAGQLRSSVSASGFQARCPFFTVCDAPWRVAAPTTCMTEPWAHLRNHADVGCWYNAGVAGLVGHREQNRLEDTEFGPSGA